MWLVPGSDGHPCHPVQGTGRARHASRFADKESGLIRIQVNKATLELVEGDITEQDTEAIVNAANNSLLGGGGVDGAIHRAGGPEILAECRKLGGCATGDAKITTGGRLKARYVIHTVGPVYWQGGAGRAAELLASAYRRSLEVAAEHGVHSVAFPSISTGAYGYPVEEAAPIALQTVIDTLATQGKVSIRLVRFVLYGRQAYQVYQRALARLTEQRPSA
jgi:O-acetyl-ADP-ribose deacetylase (regulator of RNase III)